MASLFAMVYLWCRLHSTTWRRLRAGCQLLWGLPWSSGRPTPACGPCTTGVIVSSLVVKRCRKGSFFGVIISSLVLKRRAKGPNHLLSDHTLLCLQARKKVKEYSPCFSRRCPLVAL